mgnify:CR=1 FL=1
MHVKKITLSIASPLMLHYTCPGYILPLRLLEYHRLYQPVDSRYMNQKGDHTHGGRIG